MKYLRNVKTIVIDTDIIGIVYCSARQIKDLKFDMEDKSLSVVEHLAELRRRIFFILISVAVTSGAAYAFIDRILMFVIKAGNIESLVFINPTEAFFVIIKLSILAGLIASMPFILYQVWKYVGVALKKNERKYIIYFGPVSYVLFLIGASFAFKGVLPLGIKFLLSFSKENITPMITLSAYIGFLGKMVTAFGLMFELPLVVLFLSKIGVVQPQTLKKGRKYAVVAIFILAAFLTPPDVISQVMLAVPVLIMYEISIWICVVVSRKRERALGIDDQAVSEAGA
ncbi:MAG TPA: twin-arginine translocase subunit TatC [Spirochaetes bacterium]|nr:twin-arginine translocase subunit TatC [Spirochaetota bacterium]